MISKILRAHMLGESTTEFTLRRQCEVLVCVRHPVIGEGTDDVVGELAGELVLLIAAVLSGEDREAFLSFVRGVGRSAPGASPSARGAPDTCARSTSPRMLRPLPDGGRPAARDCGSAGCAANDSGATRSWPSRSR